MTKKDFIDIVAKKGHLTKKASAEAIDVFLGEVTHALKKGERVVLSGFGTFYISKVADKQIVPFGQEERRTTIKSHRVVNFRAGKPLKRVVW
ncbi:HU family DNA-binding protein [Patescibacteria group bacterium]|nr:HU family DNA-binding protein [Patescibacteria group bacterium]